MRSAITFAAVFLAAALHAFPGTVVGQEGPWERDWEEVHYGLAFPGMDGFILPPAVRDARILWDAEAGPVPGWHVFHMLVDGRRGDARYRWFSQTMIHCADRLLLQVRETFLDDSEIDSDEGLPEDRWGEEVRTLVRDNRGALRDAFEQWPVHGQGACAWIQRRHDPGPPQPSRADEVPHRVRGILLNLAAPTPSSGGPPSNQPSHPEMPS